MFEKVIQQFNKISIHEQNNIHDLKDYILNNIFEKEIEQKFSFLEPITKKFHINAQIFLYFFNKDFFTWFVNTYIFNQFNQEQIQHIIEYTRTYDVLDNRHRKQEFQQILIFIFVNKQMDFFNDRIKYLKRQKK